MEEKELTDKEIVRIIEHCANNNDCEKCSCFYTEDKITGKFCHFEAMDIDIKLLDLIHRLQDENERLTKAFDEKTLREIVAQNCILNEENAELQKQVDELKIEMRKIESAENETYMIGFAEGEKQAVKDTAREIFEKMLFEFRHYGKNEKLTKPQVLGTLEKIVKSKGVEVE